MVDTVTPYGRMIKPDNCKQIKFRGETAVQTKNGWRITQVILSPDETLLLTCRKVKVVPRRIR